MYLAGDRSRHLVHERPGSQPIEQLAAILILDINAVAGMHQMRPLRVHLIVVGKWMDVILPVEFLQSLRGECFHDFSQSCRTGAAKHTCAKPCGCADTDAGLLAIRHPDMLMENFSQEGIKLLRRRRRSRADVEDDVRHKNSAAADSKLSNGVSTGRTTAVINPYSREKFAQAPLGDAKTVDEAIEVAHKAFEVTRARSAPCAGRLARTSRRTASRRGVRILSRR